MNVGFNNVVGLILIVDLMTSLMNDVYIPMYVSYDSDELSKPNSSKLFIIIVLNI